MNDLSAYAADDFCYLTTTGRRSSNPHTIEIWFALHGRTLYMLAGGREKSDWVRNLVRDPAVRVRLRDATFAATARVVSDSAEDALARQLVVAKYQPRDPDDLSDWGRTSLPVAVDIPARGHRAD
jgi:deazaflavin-dependent oxidoreductase (nitroreductase family)